MPCPLTPTCTGCPACNSVYAALLNAPPREQQQFAALKNAANRQRATTPAPTTLCSNEAPEPVSLVNSIRQRAGLPPLEAPAAHKLPVLTPQAPTALHGVDAPPSLIEAIQRKGARR